LRLFNKRLINLHEEQLVVPFDQILKGCRQYNKFAQKMLYEMYAAKMKGICFRYVGDYEIVKEIVQDGFIKVFSNIRQFDGKGSFDGWIKRIFINTAISQIRKQSKKTKALNVDEVDESHFLETDLDQSNNQADLNKENIELVKLADLSEEDLLNALKKIPEHFRTVFNLYCIEHIKHEEIAEILDIDTATSRTRLLRSRGLIQKELYAICREKLNR
jgi:RNA polymerase sigma-70 factor, ECF subfamily